MDVVKGEEGITREYQWNAAKLLFQPFDNLGIDIVSVTDDKTIKFIEKNKAILLLIHRTPGKGKHGNHARKVICIEKV